MYVCMCMHVCVCSYINAYIHIHIYIHTVLPQYQDTWLCVSGQESRVTHKCVIYRIKTHGRVSAAKKAM